MKKILFFLFIFSIFNNIVQSQTLYNLEDKDFDFSKINSFKKVILFFWTSQCPYCVAELNRLNKNFDFSKYKDIKFFYINIGESKTKISKFINYLKLRSEIKENIFLDNFGFLSEKYYIKAIPFYIFLKDGKVVKYSFFLNDNIVMEAF